MRCTVSPVAVSMVSVGGLAFFRYSVVMSGSVAVWVNAWMLCLCTCPRLEP